MMATISVAIVMIDGDSSGRGADGETDDFRDSAMARSDAATKISCMVC